MNIQNYNDIWSAAVRELSSEIGEEAVELWFKPVSVVSFDDGILLLKVPNKFFADGIKRHQSRLLAFLRQAAGREVSLDFKIEQDLTRVLPASDPVPQASPSTDFAATELNSRYTFETFVIGESNRFACATAEAIAKNPGTQYNPYLIYGSVGLGKTHLMHAIGNGLHRHHPRARIRYTSCENFVNEYISAVKNNQPEEYRAKYRSLDCLLVDDIQFLIGKERSEQEFFNTFNTLFLSQKQIVISSDRLPSEMTSLEKRLVARLEWGFMADIKPPDLETRIAILRKKAELEGFTVPDEVVVFVASSVKSNVRQLESSLTRLRAFQAMTGTVLTVEDAKNILKDTIAPDRNAPVSVETIQKVVALKYSVEVRELKGKQRTARIVLPRQVAMYLACRMTGQSLTDIGRAFGDRDHSTVMHGRDKIEESVGRDPFFLELVNKLQADIAAEESR